MNHDEFRREIEDFLKRTGMKQSRFGREALGDPGFVSRIRSGKDVTLGTIQKCSEFMAHYRSRDAKSDTRLAGRGSLVLEQVDVDVLEALDKRARSNRRSVEEEVKAILTQAARETRSDFAAWAAALRYRLRDRYSGDATADIRADRDR